MYVKPNETIKKDMLEMLDMLIKKADDEIPTVKKLETFKYPENISHYDEYCLNPKIGYYHRDLETEKEVDEALKRYQVNLENELKVLKIEEIHAANLEKIAINKNVIKKIEFIMGAVGIPSEYYVSETIRGKSKDIKRPAGYVKDMDKFIPTRDGYSDYMDRVNRKKRSVEEYASKLKQTIRETAYKKQMAEHEVAKTKLLAQLNVFYNLSFEADIKDVVKAMLNASPLVLKIHTGVGEGTLISDEWHRYEKGESLDSIYVGKDMHYDYYKQICKLFDVYNYKEEGLYE